MTEKREWCPVGDEPLRVLRTRYGLIGVRVWSENRINVEIRSDLGEAFIVNQRQYVGTFTLKCPVWGTYEIIGKFTSWGGTRELTPSAQRKVLDEVGAVLSRETWLEGAFVMADRREVNNEIIRADREIEKARRALDALTAARDELVRRETALGGRLAPQTEEPAA